MKAVIQRVSDASVEIDGRVVSRIGRGLVVLLGVEKGDGDEQAVWLARKIPSLRIFEDGDHNMNLALADVDGEFLVVSQFTLAGNVDKGRRPGFDAAAEPARARELYNRFVQELEAGDRPVRTGVFGAMMRVRLVNEGPVTFIIERRHL